LWRERDPVKMNGEASRENGEVQINPGERSQAEPNSQKIKLFHSGKYMTKSGITKTPF
jgi:hypothetical protein